MKILESLATFFAVIFILCFGMSVRSCQCEHRAGNGIVSTYDPIYGCSFQVKGE